MIANKGGGAEAKKKTKGGRCAIRHYYLGGGERGPTPKKKRGLPSDVFRKGDGKRTRESKRIANNESMA